MKIKFIIIGIMMVLVLCITPVVAVSGTDFDIVVDNESYFEKYTYSNLNNPQETYISIITYGTHWYDSVVTFKPANIPDAPTMVVNTGSNNIFHNEHERIYLPRSVDEWEIKYYSSTDSIDQPDDKYLKNAGVINLKEFIENYYMKGI